MDHACAACNFNYRNEVLNLVKKTTKHDSGIFTTKKKEFHILTSVLNLLIKSDSSKKKIIEHNCDKRCHVCCVKSCIENNRSQDIDSFLPLTNKESEELEGPLGLRFWQKWINQYIISHYHCGFWVKFPVDFIAIDAMMFCKRIGMIHDSFFRSNSQLMMYQSSALLNQVNNVTKAIIENIKGLALNESIHPKECCELTISETNSGSELFYFEIKWKGASKNTENKIIQVLVGLSEELNIGNKTFYLFGILACDENSLVKTCYKDQDSLWNIIDNEGRLMRFKWFEAVIYLSFSHCFPSFIFYQASPLPSCSLENLEIFKLEKLSYLPINHIRCNCFLKDIMNSRFDNEDIPVECFSCFNSKLEGIECSICGFNECNWTCVNGHDNFYKNITCDVCNYLKYSINGLEFYCEKCDNFTIGRDFCLYCPVTKCNECFRDVYAGNFSFCTGRRVYNLSYRNPECQCKSCINCAYLTDDKFD